MQLLNINSTKKINVCQLSPMKCGTTWISDMVSSHPKIHVFNLRSDFFHDLDALSKKMAEEAADEKLIYARRNLNPAHKLAERLYSHNRFMKFLVILRNPINRFYSHFRHHVVKMDALGRPCHESINVKSSLLTTRYDVNDYILSEQFNSSNSPPFLTKGLYYDNLKEYFKLFDPEQFMVVSSEAVFSQPKKYLQNIFSFCGAPMLTDGEIDDSIFEPRNTAEDMQKNFSGFFPKRKKIFVPLSLQSKQVLISVFNEEIEKIESFLNKKIDNNWENFNCEKII